MAAASAMPVTVHFGVISPSVLAELEQLRRPYITCMGDELFRQGLVRQGLVRREAQPKDKRGSIPLATVDGLALQRSGEPRASSRYGETTTAGLN